MSREYLNYVDGKPGLRYLGSVSRNSAYKTRSKHDVTFTTWCMANDETTANTVTGYALAQPNSDAAYKGVAKYNKCEPTYWEPHLDRAWDFVEKMFIPFMGESTVIESYDATLAVINKDASPGYPYSFISQTKREWFQTSDAESECNRFWNALATDSPLPTLWTNNPKEEIRTIKKVASNDLRTFLGPHAPHVVASARLFYNMNMKMCNSSGLHWSFVGSTKYYRGWDKLYRRLSKHSNCFEMDETEYDSSISATMLWRVKNFRFRCLHPRDQTPDNEKRLNNIYYDIINSWIVCGQGEIIQKFIGNPSGSFNTITDNTLILMALLAYAWLELAPLDADSSYEAFVENVEAALCGDDNTFSVSDEVVPWYNGRNIACVWKSVGVAVKKGDDELPKLLRDCAFVSMSFCEVAGLIVPSPDPLKVLASMRLKVRYEHSVKWSYVRACALRCEAYYTPLYDVLTRYVHYLMRERSAELYGPCKFGEELLTPSVIRGVYKTEMEIAELYVGIDDNPGINARLLTNQSRALISGPPCFELSMPNRKTVRKQPKPLAKGVSKTISKTKKTQRKKPKSARVIKAAPVAVSKPYVAATHSFVISHKELLCDINDVANFTASYYSVNPGLPSTFRWLSNLAPSFEEYRIKRMWLEYDARCPSTTSGSLFMVGMYDVNDDPFIDNKDFMDYAGAKECSLWTSCNYHFKPPRVLKNLYVRGGPVESTADLRFYDPFKIAIAVQGSNGSVGLLGHMYIHYTIEFFRPKNTGPSFNQPDAFMRNPEDIAIPSADFVNEPLGDPTKFIVSPAGGVTSEWVQDGKDYYQKLTMPDGAKVFTLDFNNAILGEFASGASVENLDLRLFCDFQNAELVENVNADQTEITSFMAEGNETEFQALSATRRLFRVINPLLPVLVDYYTSSSGIAGDVLLAGASIAINAFADYMSAWFLHPGTSLVKRKFGKPPIPNPKKQRFDDFARRFYAQHKLPPGSSFSVCEGKILPIVQRKAFIARPRIELPIGSPREHKAKPKTEHKAKVKRPEPVITIDDFDLSEPDRED